MKITVCEGLRQKEVATAVPAPLSKVKDLFLRCQTTSSTSFQTGEDLYMGWEGLQAAPQGRQPRKPPSLLLSRPGHGRPQPDPAPLSPVQRGAARAGGAAPPPPARQGAAPRRRRAGPRALSARPQAGGPESRSARAGYSAAGSGARGRGAAEKRRARGAAAGLRWRAGVEREAAGGGGKRPSPLLPGGPGGPWRRLPGQHRAARRRAERSGAGSERRQGGRPSPCEGLAAPTPFLSVL